MRVIKWTLELDKKLEEWRHRPFAYGLSDCCQFCAEVVQAITGLDHREKFPRYETREEAEAIFTALGGIEALASSVLGNPVAPAFAQRGDVVSCDFGPMIGRGLGICIGTRMAAIGEHGMIFPEMRSALAAWKV